MKFRLFLFSFFFILIGCETTETKQSAPSSGENILFIGNSYTYRNKGVDQHFKDLVCSTDTTNNCYVTRAAQGKYHLYTHWTDFKTNKIWKKKKWDKVILQEYSSGPIKEPNEFFDYGKKWASKIRQKNEKAEIFLYATWGYRTRSNMTDSLYSAYDKLGKEINATIVPVGLLWRQVEPKINLFDGDGAHPNRKGTFINACLFYEFIEQKDVRKTNISDARLSAELQMELKELAHDFKVSYDNKTLNEFKTRS